MFFFCHPTIGVKHWREHKTLTVTTAVTSSFLGTPLDSRHCSIYAACLMPVAHLIIGAAFISSDAFPVNPDWDGSSKRELWGSIGASFAGWCRPADSVRAMKHELRVTFADIFPVVCGAYRHDIKKSFSTGRCRRWKALSECVKWWRQYSS